MVLKDNCQYSKDLDLWLSGRPGAFWTQFGDSGEKAAGLKGESGREREPFVLPVRGQLRGPTGPFVTHGWLTQAPGEKLRVRYDSFVKKSHKIC